MKRKITESQLKEIVMEATKKAIKEIVGPDDASVDRFYLTRDRFERAGLRKVMDGDGSVIYIDKDGDEYRLDDYGRRLIPIERDEF